MSLRNSRLGSNYKLPDGREVTNGAAHVLTHGTNQSSKNRNINAAAVVGSYAESSNTATWTATDNVTVIVVTPMASTAAALQNDESLLVCFDATSEVVANGWLTSTGGKTTDVEYFHVPVGESRIFQFSSYLSRIDVAGLNDTMRVIVEAQ